MEEGLPFLPPVRIFYRPGFFQPVGWTGQEVTVYKHLHNGVQVFEISEVKWLPIIKSMRLLRL